MSGDKDQFINDTFRFVEDEPAAALLLPAVQAAWEAARGAEPLPSENATIYYVIDASGSMSSPDAEPASGHAPLKVWGDPHVDESESAVWSSMSDDGSDLF
ncbi:MAG: hypothetical protein AAGF90_23340 [Pseudomonadota bacterium]